MAVDGRSASTFVASSTSMFRWLATMAVSMLLPGASQLHVEMWPSAAGPVEAAWVYGVLLWSFLLVSVDANASRAAVIKACVQHACLLPFVVLTGNMATYPPSLVLCLLGIVMVSCIAVHWVGFDPVLVLPIGGLAGILAGVLFQFPNWHAVAMTIGLRFAAVAVVSFSAV